MSLLEENAITRLASVNNVDVNTATPTVLYRVPFDKTCVITSIILHSASTDLDTASISIGYNSAAYDDIIADATHVELADDTKYSALQPKTGAALGTGGAELCLKANTLQGAAATLTVELFGYLF